MEGKTDRVRGHQRGMHKGRGKLFREMMERQRLYAASGHFPSLPTYHGTHGDSSTVDFVIRAATVLERSGRAPGSGPCDDPIRVSNRLLQASQ